MPWTDEAVETLKKLWDQGLTTVEISKIIGVSKNSVIGKVHRLGLDKRPSPIKQKSDDKPIKKVSEKEVSKKDEKIKTKEATIDKKSQKVEEKTLESPIENKKPETQTIETKIVKKETKSTFTPVAKVVQKDFKENISLIDLESQSCRWPFGDPKDEGFHFCGKKIIPGQTYCPEHNEKAYVKQVRKS